MSISSVQGVSFKGEAYSQKKTGGTAPAIGSALIPGVGQFMDGRDVKGKKELRNGLLAFGALLGTALLDETPLSDKIFSHYF